MNRFRKAAKFVAFVVAAFLAASCASVSDPAELADDFYNLGNGYLGLKDYEKASGYYKRALELNPKLYQGQFNLVQAYVLTNKLDEAQSLVDLLLSKDPENSLVREANAFLLAKKGKFEEAYADYVQLYEKGVARQSVVSNLVNIGESLEKYDDAYKYALLLKTLTPDSVPLTGKLGILALELGKEDEAGAYLDQYEQAIASDQKALGTYAERLAKLQYYARAIRVYSTLTTLVPQDASLWFRFSELQMVNGGDMVGGKTSFAKALELGYSDKKKISALLNALDQTQRALLMQVVQASLKDFTLEQEDGAPDSTEPKAAPTGSNGNTGKTAPTPGEPVQPPPALN